MNVLTIKQSIDDFFNSIGDKRIADHVLMASPWKILCIAVFYVYFSYDLGPKRLMKNRPAFDLVWTVRIFNFSILFLNIWLIRGFLSHRHWGFGCVPIDMNDDDKDTMEHIDICFMFMYSRMIELIDTVMIVLRKKNRQITFLHVFHHSFVLMMTWFYFKVAPGGSSTMFPIINGLVHVIMYAYYTLSTFPAMRPYLWWKKYVTRLQLFQFVVLCVHYSVAAATPNCAYPRILSLGGFGISMLFLTMFVAFYREAYTRQGKRQERLKVQEQQEVASARYERKLAAFDTNNNNNNNDNIVVGNNNHSNNRNRVKGDY